LDKEKYNPLGKDTIDKMLSKKAEEERQILLLKEEIEDYRKAINRIFSTDDGKYFLNKMKVACGLNLFDKELNPAKLIEDRGRRGVWFDLIRPYLDKDILRELDQ
tara:strand:+ start:132 stop:446 length:315 start_codon:yes stop_codon:yes gene_type:complete